MEHFVPGSRVLAVCEFIESLGGNADDALERADIRIARSDNAVHVVPAGRFFDLFHAAALVTGCQDFGLRWGSRTHFTAMGPLATYMQNCATIRQAAVDSSKFLMAQNWGLSTRIIDMGARSRCDIQLSPRGHHAPSQFIESFMSIVNQLPRAMLGETWRPREVWFVHQPISAPERYGDAFGCPVRFGMLNNSFVVNTADMDRCQPRADERVKEIVGRMLRDSDRHDEWNAVMACKPHVRTMLLSQDVSLNSLAARLGLKPAVLQRRLDNVGICFRALVTRVRLEILAEAPRQDETVPGLMQRLGFSRPNVMSRFLQQHAGELATMTDQSRTG